MSASDADNLSAINYGLTNSDFFRLNGTMLMTTSIKSKKSSQKVEIMADDGQFSAQMTIIVKFIGEPAKAEFDSAFKFRVKTSSVSKLPENFYPHKRTSKCPNVLRRHISLVN